MTIKQIATVATVLTEGMPGMLTKSTSLAQRLYEADIALIRLCDEPGLDQSIRQQEISRIVHDAQSALGDFPRSDIAVLFNETLPCDPMDNAPIGGRLRVIWNNAMWGENNPLYLAMPYEANKASH